MCVRSGFGDPPGIHGAQDTANPMVRAGRPFHLGHRAADWEVCELSGIELALV
jgi:hypothetical protein